MRTMSYRQVALLRMALAERGRVGEVRCSQADHWRGVSWLDGAEVGLIYPDSFFDHAEALLDTPKDRTLHFAGRVDRGRRKLLEPFWHYPHATIIESNRGRTDAKNGWDPVYYEPLAAAEFGLCPHHTDWPGPREHLWTYRFIDCLLVGAIPVVFRSTPLAGWLTDGFHYAWDDAGEFRYSLEHALANRALAEERFRLP
jgi:hypothetical protein